MVCEDPGFAVVHIELLRATRRMLSEPDPETPDEEKGSDSSGEPKFWE